MKEMNACDESNIFVVYITKSNHVKTFPNWINLSNLIYFLRSV